MYVHIHTYIYIFYRPERYLIHVQLNLHVRNVMENTTPLNIYIYIYFQNIQYKYTIYKSCHKTKCKICTLLHA